MSQSLTQYNPIIQSSESAPQGSDFRCTCCHYACSVLTYARRPWAGRHHRRQTPLAMTESRATAHAHACWFRPARHSLSSRCRPVVEFIWEKIAFWHLVPPLITAEWIKLRARSGPRTDDTKSPSARPTDPPTTDHRQRTDKVACNCVLSSRRPQRVQRSKGGYEGKRCRPELKD